MGSQLWVAWQWRKNEGKMAEGSVMAKTRGWGSIGCSHGDNLCSLNHVLIVVSDDSALQACGIMLVKDGHIRLK